MGGAIVVGATGGGGAVVVTGGGAVVVGATAGGRRKLIQGRGFTWPRRGRGGGTGRRRRERGQDHQGQSHQSDCPDQGGRARDGHAAEQDARSRLEARHTLVVGIGSEPLKTSPCVTPVARTRPGQPQHLENVAHHP